MKLWQRLFTPFRAEEKEREREHKPKRQSQNSYLWFKLLFNSTYCLKYLESGEIFFWQTWKILRAISMSKACIRLSSACQAVILISFIYPPKWLFDMFIWLTSASFIFFNFLWSRIDFDMCIRRKTQNKNQRYVVFIANFFFSFDFNRPMF